MDALLFDLDGVLVDVSRSYRLAISRTVEHFLGRPVSDTLIQEYKDRGRLNNDWDLTETILQDSGVKVENREIVDYFQHEYLGEGFDGLILNERWLSDCAQLKALGLKFKLGIVTGRPRRETIWTLERFAAAEFFAAVVTMDDIPPGGGKPDPGGILLALKTLGGTHGWYVGDSVDDMRAAFRAGLRPVGVVGASGDAASRKSRLLAAGACRVIAGVGDLEEILR